MHVTGYPILKNLQEAQGRTVQFIECRKFADLYVYQQK